MVSRLLTHIIQKERESYNKMIFVSGPRQVGKTTVLKQLTETMPGPILNWDNLTDRSRIVKSAPKLFEECENIYFDEIHKYPRWKTFLKGYFDTYGDSCRINVTGSSRVDIYRRGGDSMMGRYILFRLHPFSVGELVGKKAFPTPYSIESLLTPDESSCTAACDAWEQLKIFGGFPESFIKQSQSFTRRWRNLRHERLVREDIRDLTRVRELALFESMVTLIPDRAAQLLSLNALREDLEVSHDSVRLWIQLLEDFYYLYFVTPFSKRIARANKKERKVYLWDYSELEDEGARFENMIASHLLKWVDITNELGYEALHLSYIRNKEKEEVDFLITKDKKPALLIEAKLSDTQPWPPALKFSKYLGSIPVLQLVDTKNIFKNRTIDGISWTLMSASRFFKQLP